MALGLQFLFSGLDRCFIPPREEELSEPTVDAVPGPIHALPTELVVDQIFTRFSWRELPRLAQVCRGWNVCALDKALWKTFDVQKEFPVKLFDEKVWRERLNLEKSMVSFDGLEPLDNRAIFPLLCKFFDELDEESCAIEENAGLTILTLPQYLSLEELIEIKNASENCDELQLVFGQGIVPLFGKTRVEKCHRVLVTNSVLTWSRRQLFFSIDGLSKKMGCSSPHVVEAAALGLLTFAAEGKDFPARTTEWPCFTTCVEEMEEDPVIVGGFRPHELSIKVWHDDEFGIFRLLTGWIGNCFTRKV